MEKNSLKRANRIYLRRVFRLKSLFYPLMLTLDSIGLSGYLENFINSVIRFFGINKNVHYFLKYKDYGKLFRDQFRKVTPSAGEILFPVMTGVHSNFTLLNLLLSKFLRENHDLKPVFYICDSAFGICTKDGMLKSREKYPWFCHECWSGYRYVEDKTGIETIRMKSMLAGCQEIINEETSSIEKLTSLSECLEYEYEGIKIGAISKKSVLRYFLVGSLADTDEVVRIYRKFLLASVMYSLAFDRMINGRPEIKYVVMNNGSLAFEALARLHCERKSIPYMTYETYIGNNSLIYKKNGAVMDLDWEEEYRVFSVSYQATEDKREKVKQFFENLQKGLGMYAVLNDEHVADKMAGVKRYVCLFTNLNYDTAVIDKNWLFGNMEEWILSVINYWKGMNGDITLVIRIHPGEMKLVTASKEYLGERIMKACGCSTNIIVFDSDEKINSYVLIGGMEYGLVYSSTIGLETAWAGKPCVVAGLPWFRDKPFVIYPSSQEAYFRTLGDLNSGKVSFKPDMEELSRTIYFVYFNRIKRFKGIRLYTPKEEPNTEGDDPARMISENRKIFEDFKDELFGTT